jgi:UDP-N-acetylmuramoylalanine--D-glutamate ligase
MRVGELELRGKRVTVVGLARSGVAACKLLADRGASVLATDREPAEKLGVDLEALRRRGIRLETGGHTPASFLEADLIVLSPGVDATLAPVAQAAARGIPVWSEVELAYRVTAARFLAVTGTNGKSTTTSLLGAMVEAAGLPGVVAGNIGTALCEVVPTLSAAHWVTAELSSFQLETIVAFRPHVALLLNLAPDHLDRYPDLGSYYAAKARIFMNQTVEDVAVVNADDPPSRDVTRGLRARLHCFSRREAVRAGAFLDGDRLVLARDGRPEPICPVSALRLQGAHNVENALAAVAGAAAIGVPAAAMAEALARFPGLPHRLEQVATIAGVCYVNDSKGTNVGAVVKSLEGYAGGVILIAGGKDKGGDFTPLRPLVASRVKTAILIGQARAKLAAELAGACPLEEAPTLEAAVRRGAEIARPGDTVLLSPACASFDMFQDFEHRGEVFRQAVRKLASPGSGGERAG